MSNQTPRLRAANDRLRAALTAEQWQLVLDADAEEGSRWCANEDRLISEFARHLPGLAPTIRALGAHLLEQNVADRGVCCGETV